MELKALYCPSCGAQLEIEDGLDTFFCRYCGHKIMLTNQSAAAYKAKTQVKHMEHAERIQTQRFEQERYMFEIGKEERQRNKEFLLVGVLFAVMMISVCIFLVR